MYPLKDSPTVTNYDNHRWLFEVVNHPVEDPWFEARSWCDVQGNGTTPHPFPYAKTRRRAITAHRQRPLRGYTHYFQYQTLPCVPTTAAWTFRSSTTTSGRRPPSPAADRRASTTSPIRAAKYTDGVTTQGMDAWLSQRQRLLLLRDDEQSRSAERRSGQPRHHNGDPCGFKGFAYTNLVSVKSTGCTGDARPFSAAGRAVSRYRLPQGGRDYVGFRIAESGQPTPRATLSMSAPINAQWDYQDLDWSNCGTSAIRQLPAEEQFFDVYIAQRTNKKRERRNRVQRFTRRVLSGMQARQQHLPYLQLFRAA